MAKHPLKLATIGGSDKYHARQFAGIFNTDDWARHARQHGFPRMPAEARIVRAWDENRALAEELAKAFAIPTVCSTLEEALEGVDGAILADDCVPAQHRWAPAVIERGIPFFLDKPMAPTYAEALHVVDLARGRKCLMFSSSAIRYARELHEVLPALKQEGDVRFAVAQGPDGRLVFYGIHPAELLLTAMGPGISRAVNYGHRLANYVRLAWSDGREAVLIVDDRVRSISAFLHTEKATHVVNVRDSRYYYHGLMREFIRMIVERVVPVPWAETLELIRILESAQQSH